MIKIRSYIESDSFYNQAAKQGVKMGSGGGG
jgi:hypothetical protein